MKTVAIIAPTGMLGSAVYDQLKNHYELTLVLRDLDKLKLLEKAYSGVSKHKAVLLDTEMIYQEYLTGFPHETKAKSVAKLVESIGEVDTVINCAGITNRYATTKPLESLFVNGAFPHILSRQFGSRLIHITTDCVYDGLKGAPYNEDAVPNPTDLYGISKLLGEPAPHSLVFRTSIIGPEITGFVSLLEWVKKQEGKTIKGFTRHFWNGVTTFEFGRICKEIIDNRSNYPSNGLYHLFSTDITKLDMVSQIAKKFNVKCEIIPDDGPFIDRRLSSKYDFCQKLKLPSFDEMLDNL